MTEPERRTVYTEANATGEGTAEVDAVDVGSTDPQR